jgi:hypothetical protein
VAAKELGRVVGAELEEEFCGLAARRIGATERGVVLREIRDSGWRSGWWSIFVPPLTREPF